MVIVRKSTNPEKGQVPAHTQFDPPDTLPFRPDDDLAGPTHAFHRWWTAAMANDHRAAIRIGRELRQRFGVSVCLAPRREGRR